MLHNISAFKYANKPPKKTKRFQMGIKCVKNILTSYGILELFVTEELFYFSVMAL